MLPAKILARRSSLSFIGSVVIQVRKSATLGVISSNVGLLIAAASIRSGSIRKKSARFVRAGLKFCKPGGMGGSTSSSSYSSLCNPDSLIGKKAIVRI